MVVFPVVGYCTIANVVVVVTTFVGLLNLSVCCVMVVVVLVGL